jgi:hypothetical protein
VDNDFMPRNDAILRLLSTKTHLIEGEQMPKSYSDFVEYYNAWRMSHLRWQREGVEYDWHAKGWYPEQFSVDVLDTFTRLKREHSALVGRVTTGAHRPSRARG